jgi:hypothetical protein
VTTRGPRIKYKCFNDCRQEGCPGHEIQFVYHHTSDVIRVVNSWGEDGNEKDAEYYDPDQFRAMLKSYEAWKENQR